MEWYVRGSDEVAERFPSPESWQNWRTSDPENFNFPNEGFHVDANSFQEELNFDCTTVSNDDETESPSYYKQQFSSSFFGGLSEDSLHHTDQLAYQLNGHPRFEQMDDLFVNSLIEDSPGNGNAHESFCFKAELQTDTEHGDDITETLDTQSISSDSRVRAIRSSRYLNTHSFSSSVERGRASSPQSVPCSSQQNHCHLEMTPPVKILALPENDGMDVCMDEGSSLEESVLQDMEMAMTQLSDNTRICFRDALYRLANNSRHQVVMKNQIDNLPMGTSSWKGQDDEIRPAENKSVESETNTIDRAIANLMFNKMEQKIYDFPVSASATSNQEIPKHSTLNDLEIHDLSPYSNFPRDAEVPILCVGYPESRQF